MSAITAAAQGNSPRRGRRAARSLAGLLLGLAVLVPATYEGAQKVAAHYLVTTPQSVSYQTPDRVTTMLEHANHSTATKAGSFLDHVELTGPGLVIGVNAVS